MTPRSLTALSGGIVTGTVSPRPARSRRTTRFGEPLYPADRYTGAPRDRDSTSAPGFARPRLTSPDHAHPVRRCGRPRQARTSADQRVSEEHRDLRRSNPELRRLRSRVHPFGRRPGVLRPEGVRQRPKALHQLPSQPPGITRRRRRRPRYRRTARLRARRRPTPTRVLRCRLLVVRQPGAGALQAAY